MFRAALSHDIDRVKKTYQSFTHAAKSMKKGSVKNALYHLSTVAKPEVFWGFDTFINIEEKHGVKSTVFFLNETLPFNPFDLSNWKLSLGRFDIYDSKVVDIIRWLDKNRWEIGVHGSYRSYESFELLKKEKKILEEIAGHEIKGTRQHYLNLAPGTWKMQKDCGFVYDASFGFTNNIGFKDDKIAPFKPFDDYFTVFPLPLMDDCFMNKKDRWTELRKIIAQAEKSQGVIVLNWHNNVFNENEYPGFASAYEEIIKICKDSGAVFKTLIEHYQESEKSLISEI